MFTMNKNENLNLIREKNYKCNKKFIIIRLIGMKKKWNKNWWIKCSNNLKKKNWENIKDINLLEFVLILSFQH
jgi:hypothetical protein